MNSMNDAGTSAYFSRREDAQAAVEELQALGIPASNIEMQTSGGTSHAGFMESVKRFFSGEPLDDYASGAVVRVLGGNSAQAVAVLQRCGGDVRGGDVRGIDVRGEYATDEAKDEQRMRLHEERLSVNKETQQAGEVRLRKEVVTENQQIDVPVRHEEVYVERRAAGVQDDVSDADFGDDREVRVPVMREEVTVETHPVVTEEVAIKKRQVEETQTVGGAVRKERARVETDGDVNTVDGSARP